VTTAIIIIILAGLKPLEEAYRARIQSCIFYMRSEPSAVPFDDLKKALRVRGGQVKRVSVKPAPDDLEDTTIYLVRVSQADIKAGAARLKEAPGVHSVRVSRKPTTRSAVDDDHHAPEPRAS
jgi:putative Mg2+ transporter-C (MgtC) family protein